MMFYVLFILAFSAMKTKAKSSSSSFLVMGDWGGQASYPYTTKEEVRTADGMQKVANAESIQFALALGDNFYDRGVTSVTDERFKTTFENVFSGASLQAPFEFKVLAGNHDHNGNVTAQVDYTARSDRWSFPSLYYDFEVELGGSSIHILMVDTVTLSGNSDFQMEGGDIHELTGEELAKAWTLASETEILVADDQWSWIESTLEHSDADFVLVAGHYPVWSICEHGPTPELVTKLIPMLEKYKVTAYLNGHDHCAQHIDSGNGVDYHTIGSAHYNDKSTAHEDNIPKASLKFHATGASGGFGKISVQDGSLIVEHLDGDGTALYTAPARKPRGV